VKEMKEMKEKKEEKWGRYRNVPNDVPEEPNDVPEEPKVVSATRMQVPFQVETSEGGMDEGEGWMKGKVGDWLIIGVEGEAYPCKDSVFRATYEWVE